VVEVIAGVIVVILAFIVCSAFAQMTAAMGRMEQAILTSLDRGQEMGEKAGYAMGRESVMKSLLADLASKREGEELIRRAMRDLTEKGQGYR
jgi:hypothetical protein